MVSRWLAALVLGLALVAGTPALATDGRQVELVLFYGEGCPHCAAERRFLVGLQERQPALKITAYEVWHDAANREVFRRAAADHGIEPQAVPTTFVGAHTWVGFDDAVAAQIEDVVAALTAGRSPPQEERTVVTVPFFGQVDVGGAPLIVATVVIGFVDGINPCSLWVLTMLLALVLHTGSRRRVLAVGSTFLVVTALLYSLFMAGIFSALDVASDASWIRLAVALVAATFGFLHVKEYVTTAGPSLTISAGRKPGIYHRMRTLADPDRSLPVALAGTVVLAAGVSAVETPCTAGLPVVWTNLLQAAGVGWAGAAVLLTLYLLVFLVDELLVFGLAVFTMRATKLQERHGRALQLVSGTLMLTLAAAMIFTPALLQSVVGTAGVFAGAALVVAVVLGAETWWRKQHPGVSSSSLSRPAR